MNGNIKQVTWNPAVTEMGSREGGAGPTGHTEAWFQMFSTEMRDKIEMPTVTW